MAERSAPSPGVKSVCVPSLMRWNDTSGCESARWPTRPAMAVASAPRMTALIVVLLAPFVEEVLFRGLVFGCLKEKSRIFAYILSCALFAFLHVWTAAVSNWDLGYLILMLQYLVPGLVFAWAYEHSGTLWTSILLHMLVNALSLFTIAS